jgi:hypothetical protein
MRSILERIEAKQAQQRISALSVQYAAYEYADRVCFV